MTKTKQNKSILYLLAIALMVAIMSVACKNKPTQAISFSEAEDEIVEPTPTPEPTPAPVVPEKPEVPEEGLKPISGLTIDPKGDLRQFYGFTFVNKDGGIAKVGHDTEQYYMEFEGGARFYQGAGPACKGGSYVLLAGGNRADVKLFANGYVNVTINGKTVQYALQSK
ncbi:hypothetical protein EPJ74_08365 [Brachyspira aalborgi]|uniref:Lipoprotein n=1 Tax=Brachyspira aalborgi TaxID=29522 RepID=A0A5C8GDD5_9SPIR|nr:hypothetical protein [Brachyspira aalborgi]TXJ59884.1 hypothetical protein EPJ74_08365 [Brachyspira aalborgi]